MSASLARKLALVAAEVGHEIRHDKRNDRQHYGYASASAVKRAVSPVLAKHGIATTLAVEILRVDSFTSATGVVFDRILVRVRLTFHDGATGATLTTEGLGGGSDSGEKAIMKAQTSAEKYALIGALGLALGDDAERTDHERQDTGRRKEGSKSSGGGKGRERRSEGTRAPNTSEAITGMPEEARKELAACESADGLEVWVARWLSQGIDPGIVRSVARGATRRLSVDDSRFQKMFPTPRAAPPKSAPGSGTSSDRGRGEAARRAGDGRKKEGLNNV